MLIKAAYLEVPEETGRGRAVIYVKRKAYRTGSDRQYCCL